MDRKRHGFTLVELIISMGLASFLLAGAISLFTQSNRSYVIQDGVVSAQQFVRSAMEIMAYETRMAGYIDPDIKGDLGDYEQIEEATAAAITFMADLNADGNPEKIRYSIDGTTLIRQTWEWDPSSSTMETLSAGVTLAENITTFTLDYTYESGASGIPTTAEEREDVRAMTITMTARTANIDPNYTAPDGTQYHYRTLISHIKLRNMGLE